MKKRNRPGQVQAETMIDDPRAVQALTRRQLLQRAGGGIGLLGLAALLQDEGLLGGSARADSDDLKGLAGKYGIRGYPSTILIDSDGNVVGKFGARDAKAAIEQLESLLKGEKK